MNALILNLIFQIVLLIFSPIGISIKQVPELPAIHSGSLLFFNNYQCEIDYSIIPGKENFVSHIRREHSFLSTSIDLLDEKQKEKYFEKHKILK